MSSPSRLTSSAMSRETAPRLTTMSLSAEARIFFPLPLPVASIKARDSNRNSPFQTHLRAEASSADGTPVRNPRPPILTPSIGVGEPAMSRATPSIVPSPPKTSSRSTSRASDAASPSTKALRPALWMSRTALRIVAAQAALSEFPMRPMRLILSACFFNQHQKFFVARRADERRFRHTAPGQFRLRGDEHFQFLQHAFVDGRIADDAAALVHFRFARLELRFD